jgi:hypothetical protein
MANYVKATNFYTKDALLTGNPAKIIKGAEIDAEYNAIATAINSKADTTSPTFTGTPVAPTATAGNNTAQLATTAFVTTAVGTPGTMSLQNANAVAITGGTVAATFTGNLTGNTAGVHTGAVTGNVTGNSDTVTNGVYTTNFTGSNQSKATNGYQKLPGGLIIQWGTISSLGDNVSETITFPLAFPTAVVSFVATAEGTSALSDVAYIFRSLTTTNVIVTQMFNSSNVGGRYMAIGY